MTGSTAHVRHKRKHHHRHLPKAFFRAAGLALLCGLAAILLGALVGRMM